MRTTLTFKCFRNIKLVETFHFMSSLQCNVILRCDSEQVSATTCKTCIRDVTGSRISSNIPCEQPGSQYRQQHFWITLNSLLSTSILAQNAPAINIASLSNRRINNVVTCYNSKNVYWLLI